VKIIVSPFVAMRMKNPPPNVFLVKNTAAHV